LAGDFLVELKGEFRREDNKPAKIVVTEVKQERG